MEWARNAHEKCIINLNRQAETFRLVGDAVYEAKALRNYCEFNYKSRGDASKQVPFMADRSSAARCSYGPPCVRNNCRQCCKVAFFSRGLLPATSEMLSCNAEPVKTGLFYFFRSPARLVSEIEFIRLHPYKIINKNAVQFSITYYKYVFTNKRYKTRHGQQFCWAQDKHLPMYTENVKELN